MKTSVIIPSRGRARQLIERVNILLETLTGHDAEVILVIDEDDGDSLLSVRDEMFSNSKWQPNVLRHSESGDDRVVLVVSPAGIGPHGAWNNGLLVSTGDVIVPGADDAVFHTGWLDAALAALATLPNGEGLVGLNDFSGRDDMRLYRKDSPAQRRYAVFFMVSRSIIASVLHGVLCIPSYHRYYMDVEACARAQAAGCYVYAPNSIVEHRHWQLGKAEKDETYSGKDDDLDRDLEIFKKRAAYGFPDDFDPVIPLQNEFKIGETRKVSVIIPSMGRATQLLACVDQLFGTVYDYLEAFEVVIVIDEDNVSRDAVENQMKVDPLWNECVRMLYRDTRRGAMSAWNEGLSISTGDLIVSGADDLWFTDGWLTHALIALDTLPYSDGLVGLNDASGKERNFATHFLATRRWLAREQNGVLFVPHYQRQFCDPEACYRAQISGRYVYAERACVEHRHYLWGKADHDWTYLQNTPEIFEADRIMFENRMSLGFPNDFQPSIPIPRVFWYCPRDVVTMAPAAMALEKVAVYCSDRGYVKIESSYAATDISREGATQTFLSLSQSPDDWLCMIDNDHIHPENIVEALTNVGNVGAVGALVRRRGDEFDELVYRRDPKTGILMRVVGWDPGELVQVDSMGGGAFAIRRWVFDKLIEKYGDKRWFWRYAYNPDSKDRPGEEVYLFRQLEDASIPMCVDTGIVSPHLYLTTVEQLISVAEAAARGEDWKKVL